MMNTPITFIKKPIETNADLLAELFRVELEAKIISICIQWGNTGHSEQLARLIDRVKFIGEVSGPICLSQSVKDALCSLEGFQENQVYIAFISGRSKYAANVAFCGYFF